MSRSFYSKNEEKTFDSLNNYEYLFKNYSSNPPSLEEALTELFRNAKATKEEAKEILDHLLLCCKNKIDQNWDLIKKEHKNISRKDALIISSYTYEPKPMYKDYSPYRLLNTNLVANNRLNGIMCIEKYLFLFLQALRRLEKCKKKCLFRFITKKVKVEKGHDLDYVPYKKGNQKTFWTFTSTFEDEKLTEKFLDDEGTKYKIEGKNLWGYDLTLFHIYGESEIILEPERKYIVENVENIGDEVIEVTCKIIDNPEILETCTKSGDRKIVRIFFIIFSVLYEIN